MPIYNRLRSGVFYSLPGGSFLDYKYGAVIKMFGLQANPPPTLGSGEIKNRYADDVTLPPDKIEEINDFVTNKLDEIRRKK